MINPQGIKGLRDGNLSVVADGLQLLITKELVSVFPPAVLVLAAGLAVIGQFPSLFSHSTPRSEGFNQRQWLLLSAMGLVTALTSLGVAASAILLPIAVTSLYLPLSAVLLLPLVCLIRRTRPNRLEIFAIFLILVGFAMVMQVHMHLYPLISVAILVGTAALNAYATVLSGRLRSLVLARHVLVSKQIGKLVVGLVGVLLIRNFSTHAGLSMWALLVMVSIVNTARGYFYAKASFEVPPLMLQGVALLVVPLVTLADLWLFHLHFSAVQWLGLFVVLMASVVAISSGEKKLQPL